MKATCAVCGKEFDKRGIDKTCSSECSRQNRRELQRAYRAANPEKIREKDRVYRAANPEKDRERKRVFHNFCCAARLLGLPPLLYAALKLKHRLTSSQEPTDENQRPAI